MSEIKPALTPEEWADKSAVRPWGIFDNVIDEASFRDLGPEGKHAAAALCLHGQPYGFTWEDVVLLMAEVSTLTGYIDEEEDAHWRSLADRIAALLPPREP